MTLPPEYQISCGIPGRLAVDKSVILLARIISYSLSLLLPALCARFEIHFGTKSRNGGKKSKLNMRGRVSKKELIDQMIYREEMNNRFFLH